MSVVCASCGQENPDGFRFCGACAAPLDTTPPAREERKVVTVLFCDLVGSTARAEQLDPEDVRAMLSRYHRHVRRELERFGGTVEKFIGDAVMALFGAPIAHEDDPERAVRAALAIREWADETDVLSVRIGIKSGEALITVGADPASGEGMAAGDVVNTAARLQAAASENGVLVDEATYRATDRVIDYEAHEPVTAKGKTDAVRAWAALRPRASLGVDVRQRRAVELVGRREELDALENALRRARRERTTQLVTLVGPPGIGKSRLVWELFQVVESHPELIYWRQGRSLPYGDGIALWALGEIAKAQAGILETDTSDQAELKLRATLEALDDPESAWIELHLRALVGLSGDEAADRSESFAAWRRFVEAIAATGPLVLVFEDLHWGDESLLDFVDHLADWATGVPLLVVGTARPELLVRRPAWGGGKANATTLRLAPLTDDETATLVHALLDRSVIPAELQSALLARAGGNPLYAEEFVRMLIERGESPDALPESVHGIIAARLDVLAPAEKTLLQDASVVGKVFWAGAVAAVGDDTKSAVAERLHDLEQRDFVRRERRSSVERETEYAFRHALVRDVAYNQIPRAARLDRHRRAAEWLETLGRPDDHADQIAHHYLTALDVAAAAGVDAANLREPARTAARRAGERALSLGSYEAASGFYARALELWPANDTRPYVLLQYGRASYQHDLGGGEELAEAADALLALGDAGAAAEAETIRGEIEWQRGEHDRAFAHFERANALFADVEPTPAKAAFLSTLARYRLLAGDEHAIELARNALELADHVGARNVEAQARITIGTARGLNGDAGGVADLEAGIAIAEAANSVETARGHTNLGSILERMGQSARAREHFIRARATAERFGQTHGLRWSDGNLIGYLYTDGSWEEALDVVERWVGPSVGPHYMDSTFLGTRAEIRLARDDVAGARDDFEQALERSRIAKDPQTLVPTLIAAARFALDTGDRSRARDLMIEAGGAEGLALWANRLAAWAEMGSPFLQVARAFSLERELVAAASTEPTTSHWYEVALMFFRGQLSQAAERYAAGDRFVDESCVRVELARELISSGRRADADAELKRALAFYRSVGARRWIRGAEALLAATG